MIERPIGSVFEHPKLGTLKVEAIKEMHCRGCAFLPTLKIGSCPDNITGFCYKDFRSDKTSVIFKQFKEEGDNND